MVGEDRNDENSLRDESGTPVIKELFEVQKERIAFERSELDLKKQHLKNQADLAKQSLTIQEKLLERGPREKRKDRHQIFLFSMLSILTILSFSVFCLVYKFEKFLTYLVGTLSHLGALALGYYFGRQNKSLKNEDTGVQTAEIID